MNKSKKIAFKLLNKVDEKNFRSLNGRVIYPLGKKISVPGNGAYCSLTGQGISAGGIRDTWCVLEVEEEQKNVSTPEGVKCFGKVKLIDIGLEAYLRYGADIHADDDYALRWAAKYGYTEIVEWLIKAGADIHAKNDYALRRAAKYGYTEIVELLIKAGADIHVDDDYALCWAAENGHTEVVELLIKAGADIHVDDDYALRRAAKNGHTEVVKLLKTKN